MKTLSVLDYGKTVVASDNMEITYKISRFIRMYGVLASFFIIGFMGALTIIYRTLKKSSTILDINLLLSGLTALVLGIILLTGSLVIGEIERALAFLIILTPIYSGIFFSSFDII